MFKKFLKESVSKFKKDQKILEKVSDVLLTLRSMGESSVYSSEIPVNKNEEFELYVKIDVYSEDISYIVKNIKTGLNLDIPILDFDDISELKNDLLDSLEELIEDKDMEKFIAVNSKINSLFGKELSKEEEIEEVVVVEEEKPKKEEMQGISINTDMIKIQLEFLNVGDTISVTKINDSLALYTKVNKENKGKTYYVDANGIPKGDKYDFVKGEELPSAEFIQNIFKDMVESIKTKDVVFEIIQNVYAIGKTKLKKILKF